MTVDAEAVSDALQLRIRQFEEFVEGLPDALLEMDFATGTIVRINHMTTVVMGWTQEDVRKGLPTLSLATPEEGRRLMEISKSFIRAGLARGAGKYARTDEYNAFEVKLLRRDGSEFDAEVHSAFILDGNSTPVGMRTLVRDNTQRKQQERERHETIERLEQALSEVRVLKGLIPICAWCHRVRNDSGYWQQLEQFLADNSDADVTHGICEECAASFEESAPRPPLR